MTDRPLPPSGEDVPTPPSESADLEPAPATWTRRWPWIVGGAVVLLLVATAVVVTVDDGESTTTDRPEATVTPPGAQVSPTVAEADRGVPAAGHDYFEALATGDLSRMGAMLDASVEGSPAGLYATHQIAFTRAIGPGFASSVDVRDADIVLTSAYLDQSGNEVDESIAYSDFTVEDHKLTGFRVDGVPVADRIRAGDSEGVSADGVTVRVVTAYHSARGDLALNVDITNGRGGVIEVADYEWSLVTADGRQLAPSEQVFAVAPSVEPGATAGHVVVYEQVGLGGTLRFVAFADDFANEIRFDVPVPS